MGGRCGTDRRNGAGQLPRQGAAFPSNSRCIGSIIGVFVNMSAGSLNWRFVYLAGIVPALSALSARFN